MLINSISTSSLPDSLKLLFLSINNNNINENSKIIKEFCISIFHEKHDAYSLIIKKRLPTIFIFINSFPGGSFSEKFYNYIHNNQVLFNCKNINCNKIRSWRKKFSLGYSNYCSITCCNKDEELINNRKYSYINNGGLQAKQKADKINCMKNHGTEYYWQTKSTKIKIKKTMLEKYGVENPMHDPILADKCLNSYKTKEMIFENELLKYKGYEDVALNFIKNNTKLVFNKDYYFGILNMPKILYLYENKNKRYYPDIFISSLNLIVEVKSEWTFKYELDKNLQKQNSCINQGYNHEFWICSNKELIRFIDKNKSNSSIIKQNLLETRLLLYPTFLEV